MTGGNIENCSVTSDGDGIYSYSPYTALSYGGGIAAYASLENFEAIKGCTFLGNVDSPIAGGIVGYIEGGNLQNNTVTAVANASSSVSGSSNAGGRVGLSYAGGIAGQIGASTVLEDCKVSSLVTVEISSKNAEAIGGIVGLINASTVRNNQSYATISGDIPNMGGVVGKLDAASYTISNNRYSSAEHGIGNNARGVPGEEGCIKVGASIVITTASPLTQAVVNHTYSMTLASDSASLVVWSLTNSTTLPAGLTLDRTTGTISGTPTKAGTYTFTVKASPASGAPATKEFTIVVSETAPATTTITITTDSLPVGTVGASYNATLTASLSNASWSISSGSLPNGLRLSSSGVISGTPTASGSAEFTVMATYGSASTTKNLSITIYTSNSLNNNGNSNNNKDVGESENGGGCDSGFTGLWLTFLAGFAFKKFHR